MIARWLPAAAGTCGCANYNPSDAAPSPKRVLFSTVVLNSNGCHRLPGPPVLLPLPDPRFLPGAFLAGAFLAGAFLAGVFLAGVFLAVFLEEVFLAAFFAGMVAGC